MKIAMFSDSYLPYASGVVRSVETFATELRRLGHEVHVIAPAYPGYRDEDPHVIRVPSYRFSSRSDFRLAPPFGRRLTRRAAALDPDIIHSHSPFLLGSLGSAVAAKLAVPLVFTHHTMYADYAHYFKWLPRRLTKHLVNKHVLAYCRRAARVIAPSPGLRELLIEAGVEQEIDVLATGVDSSEAGGATDARALRARFAVPINAPLLLFVGRLGREKNLTTLLEAAAAAMAAHSEARLLLAGDGPERLKLERLASKLGIGDRTIFTGVLSRLDVAAAYRAADLFVFASLTETQGLVLAEALAAGLPVVAVRATGVDYMVTDGVDGLLCGTAAGELGAAITKALSDDGLRHTLSSNAAARAPALSSAKAAAQLQEIYLSVLSLPLAAAGRGVGPKVFRGN